MDQQALGCRRWPVLGVMVVSLLVIVLDNTVLNVALAASPGHRPTQAPPSASGRPS